MPENIIFAQNLKKYYEVSLGLFRGNVEVKALDGVSFAMKSGKTLAIVGESGCGKSTLARLISMIEKPDSGSLNIASVDVASATKAEIAAHRHYVQIILQNPFASLNPRKKIGDIIAEPLTINKPELSASQKQDITYNLMKKVGLPEEHYRRYPHMFSGGQRQRISIARALTLNPKILVLDEPVSALDLSIQAQILNLLVELQAEFDLSYVFISHDLSVVRHMADDIMVMYLGTVVEQGSCEEFFNNPLHPYVKALLSSAPRAFLQKSKKRIRLQGEIPSPINPPSGCCFHVRCFMATEACKLKKPELRQVSDHQVACDLI